MSCSIGLSMARSIAFPPKPRSRSFGWSAKVRCWAGRAMSRAMPPPLGRLCSSYPWSVMTFPGAKSWNMSLMTPVLNPISRQSATVRPRSKPAISPAGSNYYDQTTKPHHPLQQIPSATFPPLPVSCPPMSKRSFCRTMARVSCIRMLSQVQSMRPVRQASR